MQVYLMAKQKQKEGSDYPTTYFSICGVNMVGNFVPIRAKYYGSPATKDAEKDAAKDAEKELKEFEDEYEEEVLINSTEPEQKKQEKEKKKDVNYGARVEVLLMFAGNQETGETREAVNLIAKKVSKGGNKDGETYYLECGRDFIPIEVPDFSTDERPDYRYAGNCRKLRALSTLLA